MPYSVLLEEPASRRAVVGDAGTPGADGERPVLVSGVADRFPLLPHVRLGLLVFSLFAGFAISPAGRQLDRVTYLRPLRPGMSGFAFVRDFLDHIASQGGEGVVMAGIALGAALFMRSSLPLLIAGSTEALFYFTGLVKLVFAKDAPRFGTPSYWAGGYVDHGKFGMAFPSGHTSEVVLVFGAAVLILHVALPGWTARQARRIRLVWIAVGINAAAVSWALGTHWLTDLVGGALFGALMLRVLVEVVSRGYLGAIAARIDGFLVGLSGLSGLSGRGRAGRPDRRRPPAGRARSRSAAG